MSEELVKGLSVVTLSYKRPDLFAQLADNLPQGDDIIVERIVVNNGGDEGTNRAADRRGWTVLEPGCNLSFSEGCNYGVAESVSTHVLLVSNDAVVTPEAVRTLWLHRSRPLIAPMILNSDGTVNFAGGAIQSPSWAPVHIDRGKNPDTLDQRPRFCPWLTGACIMVARDLWDDLGGMSEAFPRYVGHQDTDFSLRALERGIMPMVVMEARITHDEFGSRSPNDEGEGGKVFSERWYTNQRLQRALGVYE